MLKTKKLFVIAGEESGDTHAAHMLESLGSFFDLKLYGTGGRKLLELGQEQYYSSNDLAIVGFSEVIKNLKYLFSVRDDLKEKMLEIKPDAVVLVDYPGFNLRFAKIAKEAGIPVIYYVSPQIWGWNYKRIKKIKEYVDLMLCILPFEEEMYAKENVEAKFVGNPVVDNLSTKHDSRESFLNFIGVDKEKPLIGILPGSRRKEVNNLLPEMLKASKVLGDKYEYVFGMAPNLSEVDIAEHVKGHDVKIVQGFSHDVMKYADLLWICSGTATLEAALYNTPMIIGYKAKPWEFTLYKLLRRLPYIGLPNVLAGKFIVPEILQGDFTIRNIIDFTEKIMSSRDEVRAELKKITDPFYQFEPSETAAKEISSFLQSL